jgi:hypothetical protein
MQKYELKILKVTGSYRKLKEVTGSYRDGGEYNKEF